MWRFPDVAPTECRNTNDEILCICCVYIPVHVRLVLWGSFQHNYRLKTLMDSDTHRSKSSPRFADHTVRTTASRHSVCCSAASRAWGVAPTNPCGSRPCSPLWSHNGAASRCSVWSLSRSVNCFITYSLSWRTCSGAYQMPSCCCCSCCIPRMQPFPCCILLTQPFPCCILLMQSFPCCIPLTHPCPFKLLSLWPWSWTFTV